MAKLPHACLHYRTRPVQGILISAEPDAGGNARLAAD
jgi:hypothetical protein